MQDVPAAQSKVCMRMRTEERCSSAVRESIDEMRQRRKVCLERNPREVHERGNPTAERDAAETCVGVRCKCSG